MTDPTISLYRLPDTISPRKLARKLGVCVRTLYRWIDRGKIPQGTRQGKYLVWQAADLPQDLAAHGKVLLLDSRQATRLAMRSYWAGRKKASSSPLSAVG